MYPPPPSALPPPPNITPKDTEISGAGASGMYMTIELPYENHNTNVPPITVGKSTGQAQKSVSSCNIPITQLSFYQGHIMSTITHNIMGIGPLCGKGCSMIYDKSSVTVLRPTREVLLHGWIEVTGAWLWKVSFLPNSQPQPTPKTFNPPNSTVLTTSQAWQSLYNTYMRPPGSQ